MFSPSPIKLMKCYKCYRVTLTIARHVWRFSFYAVSVFMEGGKASLMLLLILSEKQRRKSDGQVQVHDSGSTNKLKLFKF